MYGSVQLESIILAGDDREKRLEYFDSVVAELLKHH